MSRDVADSTDLQPPFRSFKRIVDCGEELLATIKQEKIREIAREVGEKVQSIGWRHDKPFDPEELRVDKCRVEQTLAAVRRLREALQDPHFRAWHAKGLWPAPNLANQVGQALHQMDLGIIWFRGSICEWTKVQPFCPDPAGYGKTFSHGLHYLEEGLRTFGGQSEALARNALPEKLLDVVLALQGMGLPLSEPKRGDSAEDGQRWIYDKCMTCMKHKTILKELKRLREEHPEWPLITSVTGIKGLAERYAKRYDLPLPPKRKPGRPPGS
jgi:hypothetical protein